MVIQRTNIAKVVFWIQTYFTSGKTELARPIPPCKVFFQISYQDCFGREWKEEISKGGSCHLRYWSSEIAIHSFFGHTHELESEQNRGKILDM